jgi:hypothetical protein
LEVHLLDRKLGRAFEAVGREVGREVERDVADEELVGLRVRMWISGRLAMPREWCQPQQGRRKPSHGGHYDEVESAWHRRGAPLCRGNGRAD